MSTNVPKVYAAISKVSKLLGKDGIGKEGKNAQQGFNFRGIDQVHDALNSPLVAAGLVILPRLRGQVRSEALTKAGGTQYRTIATVDFDLISVEDGSKHIVTFDGEAADSGDKSTSKALSMAYKYMAIETFCIPVVGIDDGDQTTPEPSKPKPAAEPEAPATEEPAANADTLLANIKSAVDAQALAAYRSAVGSFRGKPEFDAVKAAYQARGKELTPAK